MTLARFEGYKEAAVSGFRSDSGEVRTSTNQYDVNCHLVGITDDTGVDTAHRQFINDANGIVLQKTQQANVFKQLVVTGQVMASYGLAENPQSPGLVLTAKQGPSPDCPVSFKCSFFSSCPRRFDVG